MLFRSRRDRGRARRQTASSSSPATPSPPRRSLIPLFEKRLNDLKEHPLVGEVRNSGLMGGVELVADKATKRSFDPKRGVGAQTAMFLQSHGAILRAIGDTIALCPPMVIKEDELNALFDRLELALDDAEGWVNKDDLRNA